MSITYNITTNFGAKDSLPENDPDKVIRGSEFTTEFTAIQTAFTLAAPLSSPTFTGTATFTNLDVSGTVDGRDVSVDGTKLDGIESGATADQTGAEIKAAYEAEANTNGFTDALLAKLNGIEAGATNTGDPTWGAITGSLSAQTDLQAALDSKQGIADTINWMDADLTDDGEFGPRSIGPTRVSINVDSGDRLEFDRPTNEFDFVIGGSVVATIDSTGFDGDGSQLDNVNAASVDGYSIVVDSGSPSGTDANTIYFVT